MKDARSLPPRYAAYASLLEPARRHPSLLRLALGVILAAAVWMAITLAILLGAGVLIGRTDSGFASEFSHMDSPRAALIALSTFAGLALGPWLAARFVQRRRPAGLLGDRARALRHFWIAAGITALAASLGIAVWSLFHDSLPNLDPARWLPLLPVALVLIALQTGAEELAFRGYLQSQLAARFASPLVWAVLPSLLFGAVHWDPSLPAANALAIVGAASLFGLVAADLTARTGTLGAAWGMHFANNVVAITVLSMPGSLTGLALRLTPYGAGEPQAAALVLADLVVIAAIWAVLARLLTPPARPAA